MDGWCRGIGGGAEFWGCRGRRRGGCSACWLPTGETGALPPQHCRAPRRMLPSALPRSDLRQMLATKSVENIQFLPFLTTDANNLSWLGYGCLKGDGTVITVNAIGAALQTLYILVYLYYSPAKAKVVRCKSTRCLSFPLTVTTLVASSSWTLYGLQLHDPYITVRWGGGMLRGAHPISSCPNPSYSIASHAVPSPFCSVPLLPHLTPLHPH
ncbi:sugar transporter SWEET1 isoform X11 [Serinus canaria]|uniref:sugar transporter SWEET1 isoform X11 n=1 Tax=Serinus canaria TaxID=9135 RepID=UPI0021CC91A8|nr:sugar transporter SWEET1 isoform X11 [Serinus canaria]